MSKLLKLTGIKSWIGPNSAGTMVKKGEVVRVTDSDAAKMEEGVRRDREGDEVPYWTDPTGNDTTVHHDFTPKADETAAPAATPARASRQRRTA